MTRWSLFFQTLFLLHHFLGLYFLTLLSPTSQAIAQAQAATANARLALSDSQDTLDGLLTPTSQNIAQSEAAVANAKLALEDAEDVLDKVLNPSSQDIAQAEAAVANTRLALEDAQDALDSLLNPTSEVIAKAEAAVTNAKISVEGSQEALDSVKNGASQEDIDKAQSQIESAGVSLSNSQGDLTLARKDWDGKLEVSRGGYDDALEAYQGVFQKWLGINPGAITGDMHPDALLDFWGVALESIFDPNLRCPGHEAAVSDPGSPNRRSSYLLERVGRLCVDES